MKADQLIERAQNLTGITQFDCMSFTDGLEVSLDAITNSSILDERDRASLFEFCQAALATRLRVSAYLSNDRGLLEVPVSRPIFIVGLPRTGSTVLHNLLSLDDRRRCLLRWEAAEPVPPVSTNMLRSDPRCLAKIEEEERIGNPLKHIHYESWDGPTECHSILTQDFKSVGIDTAIASPAYGEWLLTCDATSTYEYHKKFLQLMQSKAPGNWCLKQASHALNVQALTKVYPDARIVWTHRNPYVVVASFMQMIAVAQRMHRSNRDPKYIANYGPRRLAEHVRRLMIIQDQSKIDPFFHVFYDELIANPIDQVEKLYRWLGEPLSIELRGRMINWLQQNPKGKHGRHEYSLSNFGISIDQLKPYFEGYAKRFAL